MDFGSKLLEARRARGMNQEELAEALGVSRQTIYKWESGITYPDIDVLCKIAEQLGVSTGYLLGEKENAPTLAANAEEKSTVLRHFKMFSNMIGGATFLILLAVGVLVALCAWESTVAPMLGVILLLIGVFAAVILYVIAGLRHEAFIRENTVSVFFQKEEKRKQQRSFTVKIACGLALIFIGLVVVLGILDREQLLLVSVACMLLLIGAACHLFITAGILNELYADPVKALMSEERKKSMHSTEDAVGGIVMTLATVVFLLCGFVFHAWHPAWIAFPIGGVLCGVISSVLKLCGAGKTNPEDGEEEHDN